MTTIGKNGEDQQLYVSDTVGRRCYGLDVTVYGATTRSAPGNTRARKARVDARISPSTWAGTSFASSTSTSRARAKCTLGCLGSVLPSAAGMSRRTSALFTSSDHTTSKSPSSNLASGASRNLAPKVVPSATATSMVSVSTTSPPSSLSAASWQRKPQRSRPTDQRYLPVPPRYAGASATPAATSASKPMPSPLLNRRPLTSPASTTRT